MKMARSMHIFLILSRWRNNVVNVLGVAKMFEFFFFNRKLCCEAIRSLFINEGKHGGQATLEAVRLIADHVKFHNCQLHPDSIDVCVYNPNFFLYI